MPRLLTRPFALVKDLIATAARATAGSTTAPPAPAAQEAAAPAPVGRATGRAGKYDDALAGLVGRRPGVTVAQAAQELEVPATALYPVIRRLQTRGALVKRGRELHPPS